MPLPAAYFMVVLIWSTTPLTIQWSNSSLTFVAAVTLRMLLAFVICYAILRFKRQSLTNTPRDWLVFLASGLGLFPNMLLIYYAAQFIPSGLMSVLFGVLPFFVGVFSWLLLRENHFTRVRTLALVMAVTGLGIIHFGQMQVGPDAVKGVLIIMLVCIIWALSSVWVKQFGGSIEPMQQCTGSILVVLPPFLLAWWLLDGEIPTAVDSRSLIGVGYLVIAGSVISHTLYFHVLRGFNVSTVALIPLMTPVLAILWGRLLEGEILSPASMTGAGLILLSLTVYQGLYGKLYRKILQGVAWVRPATVPLYVEPAEQAGTGADPKTGVARLPGKNSDK